MVPTFKVQVMQSCIQSLEENESYCNRGFSLRETPKKENVECIFRASKMTASDDSTEYMLNPFYKYHEPSDYSLFYAALFICFFFGLFLLIINVYFCCFSEHKSYWTNSYTGNYFILPFWVRTPAGQVPIDLHELEWTIQKDKKLIRKQSSVEYLQLERKESDI